MEIRPFAGYRYNLAKTGKLDDLIAPPYDVIDDAMQNALYEKHPNNVVRLILERMNASDCAENNRYTRSAKTLSNWKNENILTQDEKPAIYVYHQTFTAEGKQHFRKGFMCRCRAVPFGFGQVYPHEITMSGPKLDRLMLTTACKMNFSQIFGLYPEGSDEIQDTLEKAIQTGSFKHEIATDHLGVVHEMWIVDDIAVVETIVKKMSPKPIFIADGHHRYETACNYRRQVDDMGLLTSDHPANYVLMVCIAMEDPGLIVLPTHRVFRGLPNLSSKELAEKLGESFTLQKIGNKPTDAFEAWKQIEVKNDQGTMALYTVKDGIWHLASLTQTGKEKMIGVATDHHPEWHELGVAILHRLIIETLLGVPEPPKPTYLHLVEEVVTEIKNNKDDYQLAALVLPATVEHIRTLSLLGDRMPAKSTYFYPKLISGFVFNPLE